MNFHGYLAFKFRVRNCTQRRHYLHGKLYRETGEPTKARELHNPEQRKHVLQVGQDRVYLKRVLVSTTQNPCFIKLVEQSFEFTLYNHATISTLISFKLSSSKNHLYYIKSSLIVACFDERILLR